MIKPQLKPIWQARKSRTQLFHLLSRMSSILAQKATTKLKQCSDHCDVVSGHKGHIPQHIHGTFNTSLHIT